MTRAQRQTKIMTIIESKDIETQEDMVNALRELGYEVTQATVSRDIKELGLIKVMSENKKYKYAQVAAKEKSMSSKMITLFRESVISISHVLNQIVVKTLAGSANTAAALIDKLNLDCILGTLAGDDTILIIVNSVENVQMIVDRLQGIID